MKRAQPTAFEAPGLFAAEALIDIVQRAVACLQDAGADRVSGVSLSLTVVDQQGAPCPLCRDGAVEDVVALDVADLALDAPVAPLTVGRPTRSFGRRKPNRRRRL